MPIYGGLVGSCFFIRYFTTSMPLLLLIIFVLLCYVYCILGHWKINFKYKWHIFVTLSHRAHKTQLITIISGLIICAIVDIIVVAKPKRKINKIKFRVWFDIHVLNVFIFLLSVRVHLHIIVGNLSKLQAGYFISDAHIQRLSNIF